MILETDRLGRPLVGVVVKALKHFAGWFFVVLGLVGVAASVVLFFTIVGIIPGFFLFLGSAAFLMIGFPMTGSGNALEALSRRFPALRPKDRTQH